MSQPLSAREILRWFPQKWSEIAGNTKIIQTWWNMLVHGLCNVLFTGPSRSGKTRVMSLGIKAMLCTNRAADLNPCGQCPTCKALGVERYGHTGVFAALTGSIYNFKVIDCERVSREELLNLPLELDLDNPRTIIYLDEVAALGHSGLESLLLKPIDESRAIWLPMPLYFHVQAQAALSQLDIRNYVGKFLEEAFPLNSTSNGKSST